MSNHSAVGGKTPEEEIQELADDLEEHLAVQQLLQTKTLSDEALWMWAEELHEKGWRKDAKQTS